jgi:DNA-binding CsgD family transcriptional regulator
MTLDLPRVAEAWFPPTTAKTRPLGDWSRYDDRRIFGAVPALARGDAERLLRFVAEAESFGGDHPFSGEFLTQLGRLVPADWISYSDCYGCAGDGTGLHFNRPGDEAFADCLDWAAIKPIREVEDPVFRRIYRGTFAALKISDFLTRRELHDTRLYHLILKPCGLEDSLGLRLRIPPPARPKIFVLDRSDRDFSARDRAVLDFLNPHLVQLYRALEGRRRLRAALKLHESTRAAVVLLEADDRVAFASAPARELLDRFFGESGARLPEPVATWLRERRQRVATEPFRFDTGDRLLVVQVVDDALLLEERRRLPRLTVREHEILSLLAEGKTNGEIAECLWLSPGTVRKHLENVYAKLGVHTRTAAASFVRELKEPSA